MKSLLCIALLFLGCSHAPTTSTHQQHETEQLSFLGEGAFFGSSKVQRYQLKNGLKILIFEDHSAPTFSYQTWFKVGSKDEKEGLTGLAHLFEHMMFKGTKNFKDGEFDRRMESAGADGTNAFTWKDYTAYVQSLPSDKLDLIAMLESDRMVNLIVDDAALKTEREVVQNERRFRLENKPDGKLFEQVYALAFSKHPYRWPVIGYEEDLIAASRQECEHFYKKFYAPNNATIVLVGDVNPAKALGIIEKYYASLPASSIERNPRVSEPAQKKEHVDTLTLKVPVEKLNLAYLIPPATHPDYAILEVLKFIIGDGKSSRLYKKLVHTGIASEISASNFDHEDPGLFLLSIDLQKGKTANQALAVIDQEMQKLQSSLVSKSELQKAIALYRYRFFSALSSNYKKAEFLGFYEAVTGNFEAGVKMVAAVQQVQAQDAQRVMRTYFRKNNRNVVFGKPESQRKAKRG